MAKVPHKEILHLIKTEELQNEPGTLILPDMPNLRMPLQEIPCLKDEDLLSKRGIFFVMFFFGEKFSEHKQ